MGLLVATSAVGPELRNIELRLLDLRLLLHLVQSQVALIVASFFTLTVLDEHGIVQLLLELQSHLVLLGLHHLGLLLLIVVKSAHLAPVRRLLVTLRYNCVLV